MDPNAKLERIREIIKWHDEHNMSVAVLEDFRELDEWLSRGGFPPDAWVKNVHYNHPSTLKDEG